MDEYNRISIEYPGKSRTSLVYHPAITSEVDRKFSENVPKPSGYPNEIERSLIRYRNPLI